MIPLDITAFLAEVRSASQLADRDLEAEVAGIVRDLGLPHVVGGVFAGSGGSAPASVVVTARGVPFLAVTVCREPEPVETLAAVVSMSQVVLVVVDAANWRSSWPALRRVHQLWERRMIAGVYTALSMDEFRSDAARFTVLRRIPSERRTIGL
ncbi:hypothetical protein [Gordonia sp. 852002-51296_SCH5728562-b]|uniref:hypothetical protein n=1 Tax=Gordonia sp. 852002-51296_SCH5728562-b TaxID=1834101 RepID=UPI0007E97ACC|nr:hypothetical protein [Gordonia sp. 852002-51296_SCH5728562-b]OBA43988.1 hypothetical protein A5766_00100 [Gordonia sp. 852002-51296_SCH5728562-b]